MAAGFIRITGDRELDRQLGALAPKVQRGIVRKSVRLAGKPVLSDARRLVRRGTAQKDRGTRLKDTLKLKAFKRSRKRPNTFGVQVTTRSGWFKGKEFYALMLEKGHGIGKRSPGIKRLQRLANDRRSGKLKRAASAAALAIADRRARVRPYPYLGPAAKRNKSNVVNIFTRSIRDNVRDAVREVGGKA